MANVELPIFVTPKTFPLGEDGRFQSEPAEAAHKYAAFFGLTREQTRVIIQAYQTEHDKATKQYDDWVAAGRPRRNEATRSDIG